MSHYTVGVVIPPEVSHSNLKGAVEEALAPFSEYIDVIPYWREADTERVNEYLEREKHDPEPDHIKVADYFGIQKHCVKKEGDEWFYQTTYNPASKWDWYVIGGRWRGMLRLKSKDVVDCGLGEPGLGVPMETRNNLSVDYARLRDLDFSSMREDQDNTYRERFASAYEKLDGGERMNDLDFWGCDPGMIPAREDSPEERIRKEGDYIARNSGITFALLIGSRWIERGSMGWFGISTSEEGQQEKFGASYFDELAKLDQDSWFVVVDCHI